MALSDTCAEALTTLREDLVGYCDWGYNPSELSRIISAIYELAEFMIRQDVPPRTPADNIVEFVDGAVVASILDIAHEKDENAICKCFAEIAKINTKLSDSIDRMISELSDKERMFDVIKDPRLLNQLSEIKRLRDS